jgi:hypothetical protein
MKKNSNIIYLPRSRTVALAHKNSLPVSKLKIVGYMVRASLSMMAVIGIFMIVTYGVMQSYEVLHSLAR